MAERVVITGCGLVCPMGHNVEDVWQGLMSGGNGMAKTTLFDASTFPTPDEQSLKSTIVKRPQTQATTK